jgi:hypothetical protein
VILLHDISITHIYTPPTNPCHFQVSGSLCAGNFPVAILCPVCANSVALPIINIPHFCGIRFRFHYYNKTSGSFALARGTVPTPSFFHAQRALYRDVSFLHKGGVVVLGPVLVLGVVSFCLARLEGAGE